MSFWGYTLYMLKFYSLQHLNDFQVVLLSLVFHQSSVFQYGANYYSILEDFSNKSMLLFLKSS